MTARRARELAFRLAACALVGAVVTVGVAWGSSLAKRKWRLWDQSGWIQAPGGYRMVVRTPGRFLTIESVSCIWRTDDPSTPLREGQPMPPRPWSPEPGEEEFWSITWARGWPMRALTASSFIGPWNPSEPLPRLSGFITLREGAFPGRQNRALWPHYPGAMTLPFSPYWPGFAVDTALYAAIALTFWPIPAAIRRRLRRARNHCPACGYDLKGAPSPTCPECGA
jgi:hypothetical protein